MIVSIINFIFTAFLVAFIGQAIISWLFIAGLRSPILLQIHRAFTQVTEPLLAPLRRYIRPIGGTLDITPMIAIFGLFLLRGLAISALS